MISSSAKYKYSQEALNAEALESRPTVANVAPQIEKGLLLPAADQDLTLIAYRLDGSPIYHSVFTPAALAPLIERGVLLPAVERAFPVIAYYPDGSPIQQGRDEEGHNWWDVCDCDDCFQSQQEAEYGIDPERECEPKPREKCPEKKERSKSKKKQYTYREMKELYDKGDPSVGLLGEPTGKFDFLVWYGKPSTPVTPAVMPKPSWSDTPEDEDPFSLPLSGPGPLRRILSEESSIGILNSMPVPKSLESPSEESYDRQFRQLT
ncbi:hypothetical protein Acr_00g0066630 [Actinidia rufa]|nr:hypothetical protein Acr_00g0066630 [Actinidia rufa]